MTITELRKKSGLTVAHIINVLGVSKQSLYNWECGITDVPANIYLKMLMMYGYDGNLQDIVSLLPTNKGGSHND